MLRYLLPLLSLGFWFNPVAVPFLPWADRFLLFFMIACLAGAVGAKILIWLKKLNKEQRRVWQHFAALLFWAGLTGLILYSFTWMRIPVLSMRFFFLLWAFGFGWWLSRILRYEFKIAPALRAKQQEREAYEKWLPKPKK